MKISLGTSKRGIALMVVLIAVFVLSMLAGAFAYSMKVESKLAVNSNHQADLEWLGRSGVEYARWLLAQENCPYHSLNQLWAGGPGAACETNNHAFDDFSGLKNIAVGDGFVSLTIIDLERKVNINQADGPTLQQALQVMGADATDIPTISDSIQDWIDRDDNPRINGAESDYYQSLTPPYMAKNGPIDDISELKLIRGIRDNLEIYSGKYNVQKYDQFGNPVPQRQYAAHLEDIFTPLSSGKININTASALVLQTIPGIDGPTAEQIIRLRSGAGGADGLAMPFENVGQLASAGLPQTAALTVSRYCTVRSSTFQVQVDAQIGSSKQTFYAVLGLNGPKDVQILSFSWGDDDASKGGDSSQTADGAPQQPVQQ